MGGRFLSLVERKGWEFVTRHSAAGVVAVVAVTEQSELVLVEEFRVPVGRMCISIPAGLAGDGEDNQDEAFEAAAERELLEETGFSASSIELLSHSPTSPGLTDEVISFFAAYGLKRVAEGGGVDNEQIVVHLAPMAELDEWLDARAAEGCVFDTKLFAGIYFAKKLLS